MNAKIPTAIPTISHRSLPLVVTIEQVRRDEDVLVHQITIETSSGDKLIVADIESDFYQWPRIKSYYVTLLTLPDRLRDAFVFRVFDLLAAQMYEADGVRCWRSISDCTRWVETQFLTEEARILLDVLAAKTTSTAKVRDTSCVDIDP